MTDREHLTRLTRELIDQGKLIEAGWVAFRLVAIAPDAKPMQLDAMRLAFFSGAQHLMGSIMGALEEDREPTDEDMRRMDLIDKELKVFIAEFERKLGLTGKVQ